MESVVASVTVDLLIVKIASLIESEVSLISGVNDELEEIKQEFTIMTSFLQDAGAKKDLTNVEKAWVESVKDAADQVEIIIEEFLYYANKQQHSGGKFTKLLHQTIYLPNNLWVKHQIGTELQKINRKIRAIRERTQRYGTDRIQGTSSGDDNKWVRNYAEAALYFNDEDLVGIEDDKKLILTWLTDGEQQRKVISVVGMGGLGKTTLVARTYKDQIVKRHFNNCYAWVTVSQKYTIEDLLKTMIREFHKPTKETIPPELNNMSYRELVDMLVERLQIKRYLVVLDDVWDIITLWRQINVSLPEGRLGSRVILTTRNKDIASFSYGVESHVHRLQPLGEKDSWTLFCMKTFSNNPEKRCPPELEITAHDLVENCGGLPLAIVALGGVMSSKESELKWRKVCDSLNWELSNNPQLELVKSILLLSYKDLQYQLKRCFLYCCLFPEDYHVNAKKLVRLWMAEGFVPKVEGITPEDVGESYLMELICRSILQVVEREEDGRPRTCLMHDVVREVALSTSRIEKFCDIYDGQKESTEVRRLSIQSDKDFRSLKKISQLHTLLMFDVGKISPSLEIFPFRLLRVLDMEDVPIVKLPDVVVDLFNLCYLGLRNTEVKELPKSIGRLRTLQILDAFNAKIEVIPTGITKLQNLRYLSIGRGNIEIGKNVFETWYGTSAPLGICKLMNLQALYGVKAEADFMRQIRSMTQLTEFGITKVREEHEEDLCIAIQNMNLLRSLFVIVINEEEYLRMDALSSAPTHLKELFLHGKLEKVPCWFHSLHNLTSLHLRWSRLGEEENPLPHIQHLFNLGKLVLWNAYTGSKLHFSADFHKLTELYLAHSPQLKEIIIERGVMPHVKILSILAYTELKTLPHGIEYLTHLQELGLFFVSNDLVERIRGEKSVDRPKVRHIPVITHRYQSPSGRRSYESLSS